MAFSQSRNGQPANYNVAPAARNDGDPSGFEVDVNGNQLTTFGTALNRIIDSIDSNWYGTPVVTTVTCNQTDTSLMAANANRKGFIITNTGVNPCWIRFDGQAATAITGYNLISLANLPVFSGYIPIANIRGIATGGTSVLAIQEFI